MQVTLLSILALVALSAASPAPTDCPQSKCLTLTNTCSMTYSGCWDACQYPGFQAVTFTEPHCPPQTMVAIINDREVSAEPTITTTDPSTTVEASAQITAFRIAPSDHAWETPSCVPGTLVCVDGVICAGETPKWQTCYDSCSTYEHPECTKSIQTPTIDINMAAAPTAACTDGAFCPKWD